MIDIELVIKIPEEKFSLIKNKRYCGLYDSDLYKAIANGISLPKGHGRLIDASKIYKAIHAEEDNCTGMGMTFDEMDAYNDGIDAMYSCVQSASTIIEADMERSE